MKDQLLVTIAGYTASGKTTLAQEIERLCRRHGVEVTVDDGADGDYEKTHKELSRLASKTVVQIKTVQLRRLSL